MPHLTWGAPSSIAPNHEGPCSLGDAAGCTVEAMNQDATPGPSWAERAADSSPLVQRYRARGMEQAKTIVHAARRLITTKGSSFTTQELVKEAGVALQTFYRCFAGKDQLLLAVFEDMVGEACLEFAEQARELPNPIARLRFYVTTAVNIVVANPEGTSASRFITTEHWRLQRLYPDQLAHATKPFVDLILKELHAAAEAGQLRPRDPEYDAWLVSQLVLAVYHHYSFTSAAESGEEISQRLWAFCLAALGRTVDMDDGPSL